MADKITTLHLKDDIDTNVYPNVKSENIIDKVATELDDSENVPTSKVIKDRIDSMNSDLNLVKNALTDETNDRKQEDDILKNNIDELGSYTDKGFSTISDQLESNGTAINANKNNIATNKASIDSINTEITEIKEKDSNQDSKISTNETNISELQTEVKENKDTFDIFVVDQNKTISNIKDKLIVLSPMIYNHHIFIKGTSGEGFPLALAFDLKNYSSDAMTLNEFMEFASKFPFSCSVQGYYISFNVDVIDFHVNDETMYLRYYQNSDVEEMPISHLLDPALVTFEDNVTGIESWN